MRPNALKAFLKMIKVEHSIFALPMAFLGMIWGSLATSKQLFPGWQPFLWIVVAMVSCRSAAMAFNRIVDRGIDALNPRTASRELPSGAIKFNDAFNFFLISCGIFVVAAWQLNPVALALSPVALGITLIYSFTKRVTAYCHLILGLSLAIAPAAAYIGVAGHVHVEVLPIVAAVMLWTAGFDIIYALQDEEFDRANNLHSFPKWLGKASALGVSRLFHLATIGLLILGGLLHGSGPAYYVGVIIAGILLTFEQSLVAPDDLSKVNLAFFTLNGYVSVSFFVFALIDELIR